MFRFVHRRVVVHSDLGDKNNNEVHIMTLIEFFDANALHFLVPVFSLKPDKLIIIYDERQYSSDRIDFSVMAVKSRKPDLLVKTININLHHVSEIQAMLETVVVNEQNEEIYMDLTG